MPYWDERFAEMKKNYADVKTDQYHVDGLSIQLVLNPDRFDVIVASNLFGDIISDLGPATTGTIGIAASGNINPERTYPSIFEPVHGSAPDIAGKRIANPLAAIWSGALMLEHLGHEGGDVVRAIERVIIEGPHTRHGKRAIAVAPRSRVRPARRQGRGPATRSAGNAASPCPRPGSRSLRCASNEVDLLAVVDDVSAGFGCSTVRSNLSPVPTHEVGDDDAEAVMLVEVRAAQRAALQPAQCTNGDPASRIAEQDCCSLVPAAFRTHLICSAS
jgi:hypothetical protein